jgi:hypothetical protein
MVEASPKEPMDQALPKLRDNLSPYEKLAFHALAALPVSYTSGGLRS